MAPATLQGSGQAVGGRYKDRKRKHRWRGTRAERRGTGHPCPSS